jgi:cytochrome b
MRKPPPMTASAKPDSLHQGHDGARAARMRIWDLPTRLFHWTLAAAVIGLIATGLNGVMEWHFRLGYVVLSLLLFRTVWGFVGGRWSRFSAFIYAPNSLVAHLRGRSHPDHLVGHSPIGALSVFALLGFLVLQVSTGLVADDDISASGPLTRFVPEAVVSAASSWHTTVGKWALITLVSLHVLAVLFYVVVRGRRLVRPMINGDKLVADRSAMPSRDDVTSRLLAFAVFAACAGLATWIASLRA